MYHFYRMHSVIKENSNNYLFFVKKSLHIAAHQKANSVRIFMYVLISCHLNVIQTYPKTIQDIALHCSITTYFAFASVISFEHLYKVINKLWPLIGNLLTNKEIDRQLGWNDKLVTCP